MPGTDGKYTFKDVVAGLRSGNSYSVNGELISDLSFTVSDKTKMQVWEVNLKETKMIKLPLP